MPSAVVLLAAGHLVSGAAIPRVAVTLGLGCTSLALLLVWIATRLALAPMENHWWQAALYVTTRGLTTSPMPSHGVAISVDFDFLDHRLHIRTSEGAGRTLPPVQQSVADFYAEYMEPLRTLANAVRI